MGLSGHMTSNLANLLLSNLQLLLVYDLANNQPCQWIFYGARSQTMTLERVWIARLGAASETQSTLLFLPTINPYLTATASITVATTASAFDTMASATAATMRVAATAVTNATGKHGHVWLDWLVLLFSYSAASCVSKQLILQPYPTINRG
jgi:hypothetical protein